MYAVSVQYTQRSCMNTCMVAHTQYRFLVFANKTALVVAGACGHVSVYRLLGGCAPAFLSMWVHAYFCCVICNERWALISFSDICGPASHGICVYTLTIPPPHTLPYYPGTQHLLCSLSQWDPPQWGGFLGTTWARGGDTYDWCASAPTLFVFVLTTICTMLLQGLRSGLTPTQHPCMHPHFTPTFSLPTLLHLIAISILGINCLSGTCRWASSQ